jgi:hypothetical protein
VEKFQQPSRRRRQNDGYGTSSSEAGLLNCLDVDCHNVDDIKCRFIIAQSSCSTRQAIRMDVAQSARSIRAFSARGASACGAHSKPALITVRCLQASAYFGAHFHLAVHDKQCVAAV